MKSLPAPQTRARRLASLDAFRGVVMFVMLSGTYGGFNQGFGLADIAARFPDSWAWRSLGDQFSHVRWNGCTLWDLVMPGFIFAVGVALPFSHARRQAQGQSAGAIALHVAYRSLALVLLGAVGFLFLGCLPGGRAARDPR